MRTRAEWVVIVAGWRRSGQTAVQYGRAHGVEPATLKWWASRLRAEEQGRAPQTPGLARVRVVKTSGIDDAPGEQPEKAEPCWELRTTGGVLRAYGSDACRSLPAVVEALLGDAT